MEPVWFVLVAVMIIAYVVLDGFDLGAGVLHLLIARTEEERVTVIRTIGSVWDGNEVWLIAGGGTLYFAFPLLLCLQLQRFLSAAQHSFVAAGAARHRNRISHAYRESRVAVAVRRILCHIERVAGDILRCSAGQRGARRPFGSGSFLL
jgi:Cytochrome bd terminal oxidase subunit II